MKDINEAFLDVFLLEETTLQKSYEEGFQIGCNQGNPEGYHLGFHRGAELGAEIGYYNGVVAAYLKHYEEQEEKPKKVLKSLRDLEMLLNEFPDENVEHVDILECADVIRAKFKKLCAQLKLDLTFSENNILSF